MWTTSVKELLFTASFEISLKTMKVLALIMVFVASTSAKGVCSPDQVAACNLQAQTLTKYHATSTEGLLNCNKMPYSTDSLAWPYNQFDRWPLPCDTDKTSYSPTTKPSNHTTHSHVGNVHLGLKSLTYFDKDTFLFMMSNEQGSQVLLHLGFVVWRSQCKISVNKSKCKRTWWPCCWMKIPSWY